MPRWPLAQICTVVAVIVGAATIGATSRPQQAPALAVAGPAVVVHPEPVRVDDPFPIRRLRADVAQVPELLKQLDAGPLVRLTRTEFEDRVQAAGRALVASRVIPRITASEWTARFVDGDLVGRAKVYVVNPGSTPRFLTLDPLRIALERASWAQDREAVLGVPAGGTVAGVWVDRPGSQILQLKWSAAGTSEPGERRFELRLPAAPTATFELELPADQVPTVAAADVLLTGPFRITDDPSHLRWHFRFGGRGRLDFAVRPTANPVVTAAAALVARYELTPGQLACSFEYDLRPAKGTIGVWAFTIDPGLRVTDVVVNNRAAWIVEAPPWWTDTRQLWVTLRQPGAGGKVTITAVAPFPTPTPPTGLSLPMVRPVNGNLDDESLELRIAPGLKLDVWHPGDYRLTDSQLLPDQTRVLNLAGTLAPTGADRQFRRPPTLRTSLLDADFTTTEQVAWRFDTGRASAVVRVGIRVRRGPLFQFALKPPAGYSLVRVSSSPDELVAYSGVAAGTVMVEFARPLTTGQSAELTFGFRGPSLASGAHQVPFPAFAPVGASERIGVLGIYPGSRWHLDTQLGAGCVPAGWLDIAGPLPPTGSVAAFRYRGGDPDGSVTLTPVRAEPTGPTKPLTTTAPPNAQAPAAPGWAFDGLYLVTAVRSLADALVVFGGTATVTGDRVLLIRLPTGAELRAASVGGRLLESASCMPDADGVLNLPCPGDGPVRFEVRYRLPVETIGPVRLVGSPEPVLPGDGGEIGRWWAFAPDVLPGWPVRAWERGTIADLPSLLGDLPLNAPGGVVVSRSPVAEVRVGSTRLAHAVGIGFAATLFALAWAAGRRRHPLAGVLVVGGLLVAGIIILLGPPWWQRAAALPLLIGLVTTAGLVVVRGHRSLAPVAVTLLFMCLLSCGDTVAQPAAPALVVILPGEDGREIVLAPKAVLDRLAAVAQPTAPGVILTAADYSAKVDEASARLVAKFTVHVLADGEASVSLPLTDARLEQVTLDGKGAYPDSPRPGVYTIPLPGKGRYDIEAHFAVPVAGTGTEREFRFGVPECPYTRVTADLPGKVTQVQTVGRIGRQTITTGDRVRTVADVGAVKSVQLRWREGTGAAAAVVKVREGCVWDMSEAGAELTACYLVRVEQGTISSLQFNVPADLDILGVVVRPLELGGTAALRDWTVGKDKDEAGFTPLRLDFQGPTTGRLLVVLNCDSRKVVTRQPVLRFPRVVVPGPHGEPDAVYGLRDKGVTIEELPRAGVLDFTYEALTRDFAAISELRLDPNTPIRVFRPVPGGVPELRPTVRVATDLPGVTLDTIWQVSPSRADAFGTLRWAAKDSPALLEFNLPGVKVLEVRGADVLSWSQSAGRVQVWRRKLARDGEIEWVGTVTPAPVPFDAITPKLVDARLVAESVRIQPADGWGVSVGRDQGWTAVAVGEELVFRTSNPAAHPVRVLISPTPRVGSTDDFGWLSPSRTRSADLTIAPPHEGPTRPAGSGATAAEQSSPVWVWPVSAAVAWAVGIAGLAVLFVRFPCSSWPEQFGLVGGLFGAAVVGHWSVAFAAWGLARLAWLIEKVVRARGAPPAPSRHAPRAVSSR